MPTRCSGSSPPSPRGCRRPATRSTTPLAGWHAAGHIGIDPGTRYADNPTGAVDAATRALGDAAATAGHLYGALHDAAEALAFAHWTGPDQQHDHDQDDDDQDHDNGQEADNR